MKADVTWVGKRTFIGTTESGHSIAFGAAQAATTDAIGNFQIVVPDFGTFAGAFHVNNVEFGGEQEGAATFSFTLEKAT